MHFINWEYASNNDLMWDLTCSPTETHLTTKQETIFLNKYFDNITPSI